MTNADFREMADRASSVPIADIAAYLGMSLVRCGNGLRHQEFDSLKIHGNLWKRWSGRTGKLGQYTAGSTVQLVQEYAGLSYGEAIRTVLEIADPGYLASFNCSLNSYTSLNERMEKVRTYRQTPVESVTAAAKEPLKLPPKAPDNEKVLAYLTQIRGIEPEIVERELNEHRLYQDIWRNCVFVGFSDGEQNFPAFACVRSTDPGRDYRRDCTGSIKAHSWRVVPKGAHERVLAFESAIEALSYMTLIRQQGGDYTRSAYVSLGGTAGTALFDYIQSHPQTRDIVLCLNNDDPGRAAAMKLSSAIGKRARIALPRGEGNDWNNILTTRRAQEKQRTADLQR